MTDTQAGWQPIETAPKDGQSILIGLRDGQGFWALEIVDAGQHDFDGDGWGMSRAACPYTHWHKITPPPAP